MAGKKREDLTIREQAVIEGKLKGKSSTEIGLAVFNTVNPKSAGVMVANVLAKELVKNEIEKRLAAQNIYIDKHLKNIDELAFNSEKDDVRLRASQDLADRAGAHYKYVAEDKSDNLNNQLSDEVFLAILDRHTKNKE
jgi:urocanate hydratase